MGKQTTTMPLPTREIRFVPNITRQPHAVELRSPWPPRACAQTDFGPLSMTTTGAVEPSRGWGYTTGAAPRTPFGWAGPSVKMSHRVTNRERFSETPPLHDLAPTQPSEGVYDPGTIVRARAMAALGVDAEPRDHAGLWTDYLAIPENEEGYMNGLPASDIWARNKYNGSPNKNVAAGVHKYAPC